MNMQAIVLTMSVGGVALLTAAFTSPDRFLASYEYASPLFDLPLNQDVECGLCAQDGCFSGWHTLSSAPLSPDRRYGEDDHNCQMGWCSNAHPESDLCRDGFATLDTMQREGFWALMRSPNLPSRAQLTQFGEAVSYNPERRAMQVRGCDGTILMSIPVSPVQARRLESMS